MPLPQASDVAVLADAIEDALPQTQCTRCGYPDCRAYAVAIADGSAGIDQCPPGGAEGVVRLAALTGISPRPLSATHGVEAPLRRAAIDEAACIGCALCLKACPVDCIVGAPKAMHTVVEPLCTGCELCLPVCPVDCIALVEAGDDSTGWAAWSAARADEARSRYAFHRLRLGRDARDQADRLAAATRCRVDPAASCTLSDPPPQSVLPGHALAR